MSVLDKKLRRDARKSWVMLVAVSAIIAVGIGCFIAMMSAWRNLEQARDHYYGSCRLADFWIDLKKAPVGEVERLATIPGISEIRTRIQFKVMLDLPDDVKPTGALLLSLPDNPQPVINNIIIREGSYFSQGRMNEVIVSEKFAVARGIGPGDSIIAVLNDQRKELLVVGTAISAEFVYMTSPGSMIDEPGSYGLMWIKKSYAENVFGFSSGCNSIVGLFTPEIDNEGKHIISELATRLTNYGVFASIPRSQQFSPMVLDGEMKQLRSMAISMPSFFLIVASVVLNILMTRLTEQQRSTIGTLKALGYANKALTFHFLKFSMVVGLAGGIAGCLFGYSLGAIMTELYVEFFSFPHLSNNFYPELALTGIGISIVCAMLGTVKGVRKVIRLEPAEAMRIAPPPVGGAVFLERYKGLWKKLDAQWQMIIRGLLRNKGRTAASVFSAAIGSAIVLLTFGFINSLDEMIVQQFEKILRSDFHLTFSGEKSRDCVDEIKRFPTVMNAEPIFHLPSTFRYGVHTEKGSVTGILPGGNLTAVLDEKGKPLRIPENGLVMSGRLMEKLGVSAGQFLEVTPIRGNRRPVMLPVVQGISSIIGLAVYADYNWLNRVMRQQQTVSEVRVSLMPGQENRTRFVQNIKDLPGIETITDIGEQKNALVVQQNGLMRYSALGMIGFAGVIFLGTILNTTFIAISERERDIATFRTMGYLQDEVAALFLRENLIVNLAGTCLGVPLGYLMLVSTMSGFATDAYSFPAALRWESVMYTVILSVVFVFIAQVATARKIRRQNWVEALSLKE